MGEMDRQALELVLGQLDGCGRDALRHLLANAVAPLSFAAGTSFHERAVSALHTSVHMWIDAIDRKEAVSV